MLWIMHRRAILLAAGGLMAAAFPAQARSEKKSAPAGGNLQMALATATVLRPQGRRAIMSVESTLVIADGALMERAQLSKPRLNAAFNEAVRVEASRMLPDAVPDLNALTRALQRATDRVLGRTGARVLLGTVMVI